MLNDTWEEDYTEFVEENPITLCSGLTYHSRANRLKDAQCMNALIFDLDGGQLLALQHLQEGAVVHAFHARLHQSREQENIA